MCPVHGGDGCLQWFAMPTGAITRAEAGITSSSPVRKLRTVTPFPCQRTSRCSARIRTPKAPSRRRTTPSAAVRASSFPTKASGVTIVTRFPCSAKAQAVPTPRQFEPSS